MAKAQTRRGTFELPELGVSLVHAPGIRVERRHVDARDRVLGLARVAPASTPGRRAALALVALGLVVFTPWELRVPCGIRAGRVPLVICPRCRRRVPDTWPHVNTPKICAVCARVRHVGPSRTTAPVAETRRIAR